MLECICWYWKGLAADQGDLAAEVKAEGEWGVGGAADNGALEGIWIRATPCMCKRTFEIPLEH